MTSLLLYHRHGCHLCDEMLEELQRLQQQRRFEFTVVDVDADDELLQRYNDNVPVLMADGEEISRYYLDAEKLLAALKE